MSEFPARGCARGIFFFITDIIANMRKTGYNDEMNWIFQNQFFIFACLLVLNGAIAGWSIYDIRKRIRLITGDTVATETDLEHDFIRRLTRAETILESVEPRLARAEAISALGIQKVAFRRFNPFQDMGGDNSFIIALLNERNTGIILSSLYMREGTRLYAKEIKSGMPRQQLSDEETQVLATAMQNGDQTL